MFASLSLSVFTCYLREPGNLMHSTYLPSYCLLRSPTQTRDQRWRWPSSGWTLSTSPGKKYHLSIKAANLEIVLKVFTETEVIVNKSSSLNKSPGIYIQRTVRYHNWTRSVSGDQNEDFLHFVHQIFGAGRHPLPGHLLLQLQDLPGGQPEEEGRQAAEGGQPLLHPHDNRGVLPHVQRPQDIPQHARDHRHSGDLRVQVEAVPEVVEWPNSERVLCSSVPATSTCVRNFLLQASCWHLFDVM